MYKLSTHPTLSFVGMGILEFAWLAGCWYVRVLVLLCLFVPCLMQLVSRHTRGTVTSTA